MLSRFVEIQQDLVLIDSRVYCRDVIEVDHGDWLSNVLYKHQAMIEDRFGTIQFRDTMLDVITNTVSVFKTKSVNVITKYALLTESQCNACLVLSKNLKKTVKAKFQLVADFESAKQQLKLGFERSLAAVPASLTSTTLHQETEFLDLLETPDFPFPKTVEFLHQASGIADLRYIRRIIKKSFKENVDYIVDNSNCTVEAFKRILPTHISQDTFNILMLVFRSKRGASLESMDKYIIIERDKYFQMIGKRNPNKRIQHSSQYIQPSLF